MPMLGIVFRNLHASRQGLASSFDADFSMREAAIGEVFIFFFDLSERGTSFFLFFQDLSIIGRGRHASLRLQHESTNVHTGHTG
jgi:hypothetical protein